MLSIKESLMESPVEVQPGPAAPESQEQKLALSPADRFELMQLQTDVRIRQQELNLARVKLETAQLLSDAAGERVLAKMNVPKDVDGVTIDINLGVVQFKVPASS